MKGYLITCYVPSNVGTDIPIDLSIKANGSSGIELTTSEFTFNLSLDDAQDLVESLTLLLEEILEGDDDV